MVNVGQLQAANRRRTFGLLLGMGILVFVVLYAALTYFGKTGVGIIPIAVTISLISVWGSYWASDSIVLRMTGAKLLTYNDHPKLFDLVEEVCKESGMAMPKVAVVEDSAPNAFATGRNESHALIAFTTGILNAMDEEELKGVTAHELAHVKNRDTLVSAVAATTAGAIALLSDFIMQMMWWGGGRRNDNQNNSQNPLAIVASLIVLILAPFAALLLRTAISRRREALADVTAVSYTKNPAGLRKALEVLQADTTVVAQRSTSVAHIWIESPLDSSAVSKLFMTHPPLSERIAILKELEANQP